MICLIHDMPDIMTSAIKAEYLLTEKNHDLSSFEKDFRKEMTTFYTNQ